MNHCHILYPFAQVKARMDSSTITVHWHDENQPVYSVDFQPQSSQKRSPRLATGGGDNNVRIWKLVYNDEIEAEGQSSPSLTKVEYLTTLRKHTQAVNVVRFDPKGEMLATAGDDGTLILWTLSDEIRKDFGQEEIDEDIKETWIAKHVYRSSTSEIYDLSWSPDSKFIATGSMDNITRIYNVSTGQEVSRLAEHNHYVQGVAWDPRNEFLSTQSADRSIHIYSLKNSETSATNEIKIVPTSFFKIVKAELPNCKLSLFEKSWLESTDSSERSSSEGPSSVQTSTTSSSFNGEDNSFSKPATPMNPPANNYVHQVQNSPPNHKRGLSNETLPAVKPMVTSPENRKINRKNTFLYHPETLQSFFRRLAFSPDGSLLLTPLGIHKNEIQGSNTTVTNENDDNDMTNNTNNDDITNTVYIYIRSGFNKAPICHIPGLKKPAIAISFSPIIYEIESKSSIFKLPYKMIFAVATQDSVIIYDTASLEPLGMVSNLHYSTITDLCWNTDGESIIISSADGFCSVIVFNKGIFGNKYKFELIKSEPVIATPKKPEEKKIANDITSFVKKKKLVKNNEMTKDDDQLKKKRKIEPTLVE